MLNSEEPHSLRPARRIPRSCLASGHHRPALACLNVQARSDLQRDMTVTSDTATSRYEPARLYIGGDFQIPDGICDVEVENPASEQVLGVVPQASDDQVSAALTHAHTAFLTWSRTPVEERASILHRAADVLRRDASRRAWTLTLEQGKPLAESIAEITTSAELFDCFADLIAARAAEPGLRTENGDLAWVQRDPIGPIVVITPWNFPVSLAARKVGAAIAAGCTVIVKPASETPASFGCVAAAFHEVGLPPGVLGVVNGRSGPLTAQLITGCETRAVSFTGSTRVGRVIAGLAAESVKPVTLELGGHAAVIVTADADLESAAAELAATKYRNAGQVCVSPTRFLVQRDVCAAFTDLLVGHAARLVVGNGALEGVNMGPLANASRRTAVESLVEDAVQRGAKLAYGGSRVGSRGHFLEPTVLASVPLDAVAMQEEPFGPVALVRAFDNLDEGLDVANSSRYGLAGYLYTGSEATAERVIRDLQVGMLGVNTCRITRADTPVGGVKDSGYGRDGGIEGLDEMFVSRAVTSHGLART
jgi:succinate-semialdehyde dehydrogenase/glutarate-semialdehyde dehydrogenase